MRRNVVLFTIAIVVAALAAPAAAQPAATASFVPGEIVVKFKPGVSANATADAHRRAHGTLLRQIARTGVQLIAVAAGEERRAIARYQQNPNVLYAERNYIRRIPMPASHTPGSEVVPGDYYFDEQWALHNAGQQFYCIALISGELCLYIGTPDADIDAPEAWAMSTGTSVIKVAVVDSGVDYTHPDLAANYAGGDDFVFNDGDPMDDHGHGTHVAGTIAAAMNNPTGSPAEEEGVVGVDPNARILAYKVCRSDGTCSDFAIGQAIARAITDGARVINMSLGGADFSQSMADAVQDAWNAGLVIVAAAGNDGTTDVSYPAGYDHVIAVAAFDEDGKRASFSNYGGWVDISAPGNVIMSTYPMSACTGEGAPGDTGCYTWLSGTSMATPHVSGAAALVWSRSDVSTNSQVVDILLNSADPRGVDAVRLDSWTVHGGLNLHDALSYGIANVPPVANAGPDQVVTDTDGDGAEPVSLDGSASADPDGTIVSYEWREAGTLVASGATPTVSLAVGSHTLTLQVMDDDGDTGTDSVTVTVEAPNAAPVAANASLSTVVGTPVTVTLNATDADTCELTFSIVQPPASGTLDAIENQGCVAGNPNRDTARIVYAPGGAAGIYSFTYRANDGSIDSNVATVTITVTAPPVVGVTVTGISPSTVHQNAGLTAFTISGDGFAPGASVAFVNGSGPAPRVLSVTRDSSTQLTASVEIRSGGPKKGSRWDVRVTNPDGSTGTGVGLLTILP